VKSHKIAHKILQNRLRLGLHPRPRWRSLRRSARLPSWLVSGVPLPILLPPMFLTTVVGRLYGQEGEIDPQFIETWLRPWLQSMPTTCQIPPPNTFTITSTEICKPYWLKLHHVTVLSNYATLIRLSSVLISTSLTTSQIPISAVQIRNCEIESNSYFSIRFDSK